MDGPVVIYKLSDSEVPNPLMIRASRKGVELSGDTPPLAEVRELEHFAHIVSSAWKDYMRLKPKIVVPGDLQ